MNPPSGNLQNKDMIKHAGSIWPISWIKNNLMKPASKDLHNKDMVKHAGSKIPKC